MRLRRPFILPTLPMRRKGNYNLYLKCNPGDTGTVRIVVAVALMHNFTTPGWGSGGGVAGATGIGVRGPEPARLPGALPQRGGDRCFGTGDRG